MLAIDSNNFLRGKDYGFRKKTLNLRLTPYDRLADCEIITSDIFYNYQKGKKLAEKKIDSNTNCSISCNRKNISDGLGKAFFCNFLAIDLVLMEFQNFLWIMNRVCHQTVAFPSVNDYFINPAICFNSNIFSSCQFLLNIDESRCLWCVRALGFSCWTFHLCSGILLSVGRRIHWLFHLVRVATAKRK